MKFDRRPPPLGEGELRRNRQIRMREVRLIGDAGEQLGVVATEEAIRMAQDAGLDLVEVAPTARPPVCKIMDYGKYKYRQSKKKHEAKRHQVVTHIKEVKLRPNTGEHDLEVKISHIRRFLSEKDKARVMIVFRGREMEYAAQAMGILDRIVKSVEKEGKVETPPKREGRMVAMMLAPL